MGDRHQFRELLDNHGEWFVLSLAVVAALGAFAIYVIYFKNVSVGGPHDWALFGDYFGGVASPIVALAAVGGIVIATRLQRQELRATKEELRRSASSQAKLVEITKANAISSRVDSAIEELRIFLDNSPPTISIVRSGGAGADQYETRPSEEVFSSLRFIFADEDYALNVNDRSTAYLVKGLSDRLFNIYRLATQADALSETDLVSTHSLLLVGGLIIDLQQAGSLVPAERATTDEFRSFVQWAAV